MCGEHALTPVGLVKSQGSSPHVRGTHGVSQSEVRCPGIIPACAGNTRACERRHDARWDHPRMCGEHWSKRSRKSNEEGSSPHVRGTPPTGVRSVRPSGIIPACAGNTLHNRRSRQKAGDHPRMCGEHAAVQMSASASPGSSPHVRGTQVITAFASLDFGIIPACAGNTVPLCTPHP